VSLIAGYQIKPTRRIPTSFRPVCFGAFRAVKDVWREQPIRLCVLGITYFYGLAGALTFTLLRSPIRSTPTCGHRLHTGVYAATLGLGIISGSFLVTRMTTHQ